MKIQQVELAQKINKLKSVVPKKPSMPILKGILVQDGYLTANNVELTVKAKVGVAEGESFIIPEKAFDLINNLPDGELDISALEKDMIMIKARNIKNKYQTMPAENFPTIEVQQEESKFTIKADKLLDSMKRVSYAVPIQGSNQLMSSMCLSAAEGRLNFVGLDGHLLAWDKVWYDGKFELLIPKNTVDKLNSLGLSGEVQIRHNKTGALFITDEFEVFTRLVEGKYFQYQRMFQEYPLHTTVLREELLDAITRAKMCAEDRCPVRFELKGNLLNLSIRDNTTEYHEEVELLEEMTEEMTIGFNAKLVIETLKAFKCDEVRISFSGSKMPAMIEEADSDFKAIVLPVKIE